MYRISLLIHKIYNKHLPTAEQARVQFDLDLADPDQMVADPEELEATLDQHLSSALRRTTTGKIKLAIQSGKIVITDTGTTLSPTACTLLSRGRVKVKSRVGFGTRVQIDLSKKA